LAFVTVSCAKKNYLRTKDLKASMIESPQTQADIDRNRIVKYALANKLKGNFTSSGIFYTIDNPGEGMERPTTESTVTAHYTGKVLSGKKFDSSYDRDQPLEFKLGQVIKGWQEAIRLLGKGGKGTFLIPSELAYGDRAVGEVIKENSVLAFDVELLDFKSE
ncbi:MAG: FKBP-type peptidyl-prolyl cis-trans isomerase, partial [Bacteroidota bacterium]